MENITPENNIPIIKLDSSQSPTQITGIDHEINNTTKKPRFSKAIKLAGVALVILVGLSIVIFSLQTSHAGSQTIATIATPSSGSFTVTGCKTQTSNGNYLVQTTASFANPQQIQFGTNGVRASYYVRSNNLNYGNSNTAFIKSSDWVANTSKDLNFKATDKNPNIIFGISTNNSNTQNSLDAKYTQTVDLTSIPECGGSSTSSTISVNSDAANNPATLPNAPNLKAPTPPTPTTDTNLKAQQTQKLYSPLKVQAVSASTTSSKDPNAMVLTYSCANPYIILSGNNSSVTINWGDKQSSNYTLNYATAITHQYSNSNKPHTVTIVGSAYGFGGYPSSNLSNYANCISKVSQWGNLGLTSLDYAFYKSPITSVPKTLPSTVTNMSGMFYNATNFNQPLNSWNTANVTYMGDMFYDDTSFNQLLNSWNTANVTDMEAMFEGATNFNQPLNSWNTANVTDMEAMFAGATNFNQPLNSWNTAKVTHMGFMFEYDTSFNQPLNSWNTANVTDMSYMFSSATSFNQPLNSWNTANFTNMYGMFEYDTSFNQPLNSWNTANVTNMYGMFEGATNFNQPLNSWNTANVTDMSYMFFDDTSFNQLLNSWNTANVTDMGSMFEGATNFNQPLNSWNTAKVTSMSVMFDEDTNFNQPLNSWNTAKVTNMGVMFAGAINFNQPLNSWNTANVTDMSSMFEGATNFNQDLSSWNVKKLSLTDSYGYTYTLPSIFQFSGLSLYNALSIASSWINQNPSLKS